MIRIRNHGFTLVELIIVVAIIMLLAAMFFPVFEAAMARAESTSCLSNLRNMGMAVRLYADDYEDAIVPASVGGPPGYQGTCWDVLLQRYLRNRDILLCPSDESPTASVPGRVSLPHSYGINFSIAFLGGYNASSLRIFEIEEPARVILFCEIYGTFRTFGVSYPDGQFERVARDRHSGGANYTFVDGHARWLQAEATVSPVNMWQP